MDDLSIYDFKTNTFSVWDYVVFGGVLAISASIGIYYGCTGGKQKTTSEFLMADRKMHLLPVTLSLLASFMSAITLLGKFYLRHLTICQVDANSSYLFTLRVFSTSFNFLLPPKITHPDI